MKGDLFIVSAPSGAGKTTLIRRMMDGPVARAGGIAFSVSHTTRSPREGEEDGVDYHFVSNDAFRRMIDGDEFVEWAEVHGRFYGTSTAEVLPRLGQGVDVLLDIDVQGAQQVRRRLKQAHSIFILPPSYEALRDRLVNRGLDDEVTREARLRVSVSEIQRYDEYQYVIINDDLDRASEALASIVRGVRQRLRRQSERVEEVLEAFAAAIEPGSDGP